MTCTTAPLKWSFAQHLTVNSQQIHLPQRENQLPANNSKFPVIDRVPTLFPGLIAASFTTKTEPATFPVHLNPSIHVSVSRTISEGAIDRNTTRIELYNTPLKLGEFPAKFRRPFPVFVIVPVA